ncbi:vWA domain-containing protein, partial [Frankia sp. AgKG'84/4]|uniref:vWA domain-containing protein n=1 Tax=Frankia sp. AgKG'84/4 TaxID=573490 RepID=UPI00202A033D
MHLPRDLHGGPTTAHRPRRSATAAIIIGLLAVLATVSVAAAPARAAPSGPSADPPWQSRCPMRVSLVLDLSPSMGDSADQLRSAAKDLVDALRGGQNVVSVVTFSGSSRVRVPPTDVSRDADRAQVKREIGKLKVDGLFSSGGTNWQAGLETAAGLSPHLVILISDGEPTMGTPSAGPTAATGRYASNQPLGAAVEVANRLRDSAVRIVAVGIGSKASTVPNLAEISGPRAGDDYFTTDSSHLLRELYQIVSRACGIPVGALPGPQGNSFPLAKTLIAGLLGLVLLVGVGMLVGRSRSRPAAPHAPRSRRASAPIPDRTIDHRQLLPTDDDVAAPPDRAAASPSGASEAPEARLGADAQEPPPQWGHPV